MIITSNDGRFSLELSPVAYEFAGAEEVHDRNWLKVRVKASTPLERWGGTDPCLLTWELRMLKSWFAAQAEDPPQADNEIEFLEPELAFKILERTPDTVVLRVTTQYGVTHSLSGANSGDSSKRELDLTVRRTTLASASDALAREVASFPQR